MRSSSDSDSAPCAAHLKFRTRNSQSEFEKRFRVRVSEMEKVIEGSKMIKIEQETIDTKNKVYDSFAMEKDTISNERKTGKKHARGELFQKQE